MKITITLLSLCIIMSFGCFGQVIRRALFLGNSYTYVNNLPQIIANAAHSTGDSLFFDSHTPGGFTLDDHEASPISKGKIMLGSWDYLILQEQSQLPSFPVYFCQGLFDLNETNKTYNPCGRLMFYMTWGRQNGDATNCGAWPPVCSYIGMDTLLRTRYIQTAAQNNAELSPVGAAWRYVRQHYPAINLYQPDESHPSVSGSYLAACCFYAAIFKKNPTLITYNSGLTASEANTLKLAAKLVVYDSLSTWGHIITTPTVNFGYTIGNGNNQVDFTNLSVLADSYLWNFGDGTTSTLKNPVHNYTSNGVYTVTLTGYNCDIGTTHQATHQETVSFCAFTPTVYPDNLKLCFNDTDTLWTQSYSAYQWFELNGSGIPNTIPGANGQYFPVSGGHTYFVQVSQNNCKEMSVPVNVDMYSMVGSYMVNAEGNFIVQDTACIGDTLRLILSPTKPVLTNNDPRIDWTLNGQAIAGHHNDTLLITASGIYGVALHHEFCPGLDVYNNQQLKYTFIECYTGIPKNEKEPAILVYPNPSEDMITVQIPDAQKGSVYKIMDVMGRVVLSGKLDQSKTELHLNALAKGVYMLQVEGISRQNTRFIKK